MANICQMLLGVRKGGFMNENCLPSQVKTSIAVLQAHGMSLVFVHSQEIDKLTCTRCTVVHHAVEAWFGALRCRVIYWSAAAET